MKILAKSRRLALRILVSNKQEIINTCLSYDCISFDLFDTLVKRDVFEPSDVFKVMAIRAIDLLGHKLSNRFYTERIKAEAVTRKQEAPHEILINTIYENMPTEFHKYIDSLVALEIDTEKRLIVPNSTIIDIYNKCVENKKEIYITTNTYLPEHVISDILIQSGISRYKKLYVSSTSRKRKQSGLFTKLLTEENISPTSLIHIGDSYVADFLAPKRCGIKCKLIHRENCSQKNHYVSDNNRFYYTILQRFIANRIDEKSSISYYTFGYKYLGPFLFGFSKWLHDQCINNKLNKLIFLSRDGKILKNIYNIVNPEQCIDSEYLYVSRRCLRVPNIYIDSDYKNIILMMPYSSKMALPAFFEHLGLNISNYQEMLCESGFNALSSFMRSDLDTDQKFSNLYSKLKSDILENAKQEYSTIVKKIKSMELPENFAIVDIGWHGSMQTYLEALLRSISNDKKCFGFYVGLFSRKNNNSNLNGYLNRDSLEAKKMESFRGAVGLLEFLLTAREGSMKRYIESDGIINTELYEYEYTHAWEDCALASVQEGAMAFAQEYSKSIISEIIPPNSAVYDLNIYLAGTAPSTSVRKLFSSVRFKDESIEYLSRNAGAVSYLLSPKKLIRDLYRCKWKIGFLSNLIKVPINYVKLYDILNKYGSYDKRKS